MTNSNIAHNPPLSKKLLKYLIFLAGGLLVTSLALWTVVEIKTSRAIQILYADFTNNTAGMWKLLVVAGLTMLAGWGIKRFSEVFMSKIGKAKKKQVEPDEIVNFISCVGCLLAVFVSAFYFDQILSSAIIKPLKILLF